MNRRKAVLAVLIAAALPGVASAGEFRSAQFPIEGQYIVVFKSETVRAPGERSIRPDVITAAINLADLYNLDLDLAFEHALQGFSMRASPMMIDRLLKDPRVDYVEQDSWVYTTATQSNATWGLDRIDQRSLPLNTQYISNTTAGNVHAYVIDTGIRATHTDFGGRVSGGFTAISDGRGTGDCNGHGTHVAGTVGGATWGVAKAVRLHPVRVLDCAGSGTNSGVIAGVDWVTANHVKPAVANMSLGGGISTALDTSVANSISAGVFYAVAAGNDNSNACNFSPARVASAMTAGSTTTADARSSFSNFGTCVDMFAPGSAITSAWMTNDTSTNTISGTSMASPHIAGVGALFLATSPSSTPAQVTTALINNASLNKLSSIGTGSPNRLLHSLFGAVVPPGGFFENTADFTINDFTTIESPIAVTGTGNAPSTLAVGVTIFHTWKGDLKVDLVAPDGSVYVLHNRTGTSTDNIIQTFTVNASSELKQGTWKLRVNDNAAGDVGRLDKWSLQF